MYTFKPTLVRVTVFYMIFSLLLFVGWAIWFGVAFANAADAAFDGLLIATIISQVFSVRKFEFV